MLFRSDLATAVYVGNDDRKSLGNKMTGGVVAAPIWANFMKNSLINYEKKDFIQPDDIIEMVVCEESGMLPTDSCTNLVKNVYLKGTEPNTYCNIHQSLIEKPIPTVTVKEFPEIKRPYFEKIEIIKEKIEEKYEQPQEEETLQSLIDKLKEKYKKDKK